MQQIVQIDWGTLKGMKNQAQSLHFGQPWSLVFTYYMLQFAYI